MTTFVGGFDEIESVSHSLLALRGPLFV
jgi:hypothetical protein